MSASQLPSRRVDGAEPTLVLGRYRLRSRLGAGAFATVYAAWDERLQRDVALKIASLERVVPRRFETEARAAARLAHPAIVTLHEAAVDDEGAYLVTELVRGCTLQALLERGHLSDRDILEIALALADALAHAHANGVIHRDLKPSNVLVPAWRERDTPPAKLTDFGVARVLGGDSLTRVGDVVGTSDYMPPEQAEGREAGPAADLYALALVLYEALTGANPVRTLRIAGTHERLGVHLPPLRRSRRELPRGLGVAVDRALRPRPDERGELGEFRQALVDARSELEHERQTHGHAADGPRRQQPTGPVRQPGATAGRLARAAGPQAGGTIRTVRQGPVPWPEGTLGAAAAGLTAWWLCGHLLTHAPVTGAAAGLGAAAVSLVLPRAGATCVTAAFALLAVADGRPGGALALLAVALGTFILLPGAGRLWPAPAGAVALALLGLGGAWPAVVGCTRLSLPRRAGLAGAGFIWAGAAGALTRTAILVRPEHLPAPAVWTASVTLAVRDLLGRPALQMLLPAALVWALAGAVAPLLTRRLAPAVALPLIGLWSAVTVAATQALCAGGLQGAVLGAVVGAAVVGIMPIAELGRAARRRAEVVASLP